MSVFICRWNLFTRNSCSCSSLCSASTRSCRICRSCVSSRDVRWDSAGEPAARPAPKRDAVAPRPGREGPPSADTRFMSCTPQTGVRKLETRAAPPHWPGAGVLTPPPPSCRGAAPYGPTFPRQTRIARPGHGDTVLGARVCCVPQDACEGGTRASAAAGQPLDPHEHPGRCEPAHSYQLSRRRPQLLHLALQNHHISALTLHLDDEVFARHGRGYRQQSLSLFGSRHALRRSIVLACSACTDASTSAGAGGGRTTGRGTASCGLRHGVDPAPRAARALAQPQTRAGYRCWR